MRIGERHDLPAVGRIGEDLLVAVIAVLNTTSPTALPRAPMERPRNTVPSARTRTAASDVDVISGCGYEKREALGTKAFVPRFPLH
jgi:hypothetical protein